MKAANVMRLPAVGLMALLVAACASIGNPQGGPRDEQPPVFVRANPAPGSLNVDRQKIELVFDENIKLESAADKLVVSPAQKTAPRISSNAKHVTVELQDSLVPDATYTLDFGDAIRDLNEGNILDGFALDFATGDHIDTLRISGMVFEARTLEPAQGMVVGIHSNLSDTAITTLPLERVAKTNQYGEFTIRGLKPGTYNLYALDDRNRDWRFDRSENVAFATVAISPVAETVEITDTLRASDGTDSLRVRQGVRYLPDDVLLTWFNENYRPSYLRDYERTDRNRVTLKFGAPLDSLPEVTILTGERAGQKLADLSVIERRQERDSLVYWLADSALRATDSLLVAARYLKTDTLNQLVATTDTLKLFYRQPKDAKKRKKEEADTVPPPVPLLEVKMLAAGQQDLNTAMAFETALPLASLDSLGVRLEMLMDTLWLPVADHRLTRDTLNLRHYEIRPPRWEEGTRYRLTLDSLAMTDITGVWNKQITAEVTTKRQEDYGAIVFHITDIRQLAAPDASDSLAVAAVAPPVVVELLSQKDTPVQTLTADLDGMVRFSYLAPGTYYARAFLDLNANGKWDTGNMASRLQPEDVYYYPKKLVLKKNWDIDQDWSLLDTPVDAQKPNEIKKNKPKTKDGQGRGRGAADSYEDDEEEDDFGTDPYGNDGQWGNGSQYNNSRRGSSSSSPSARPGLQRARDRM